DDAFKLDISDIFGYGSGTPKPQGSVFMYFKFDDNNDMLYVGGEDFLNPTLNDNEGFGLYFDDNNNNVFDGVPPFIQEGNFWAYWHPGGADLRFRDLTTFLITSLVGAQVAFTDGSGHLQGEVAIPMGFLEGYQLQVFGPDKTPGLGAFIIGRQPDQSAIFNGWWPQTMNSVFNPQYFGDVGIDVTLTAPPQSPSNITVTRQGNDLLINWTDPSLGLNNEPLTVTPTINIYKNGEFLTSVSGGVQFLLDGDVYCPGWYEYQLEAFIEIGPALLTGPISAPVGNFACEEPVLTQITYDDGEWDGFYAASFSWENNKFAVRFTPQSYPAYVRRMETTVNGNDDFDFTIQADEGGFPGDTIAGPYRIADSDPAIVGVVTKTIPGNEPPEIREGDFWVVISWLEETPGAPGIGVDVEPPIDNRSMQYLSSTGWQSINFGDIMITAYISDITVGVEEPASEELPLTFDLKQNYPNPFNPSTVISYQLPKSEVVSLEIYNALGQKVRTLVNQTQEAGYYNVEWDGKNNFGNPVSSGMYLYRIKAGNFVNVRKMILVR
ncbi:MAG: FlgD immunoglobulin-like domain containing protein, partial [Ignavibacteria bacterium]|nr:FlgD immunoglobulin-like domain containing protein [Ignavibacteria bacterium]